MLDVLEVLLVAMVDGEELHGWAVMKAVRRAGPTVYGVLDELEDAGWVDARWEQRHAAPGRPRRRYYRLTAAGVAGARRLVVERRPQALRPLRGLRPGWVWPAGSPIVRGAGAR
jgi:DNA-binding PadR family transcriptional regulator